MWYIHPKIKLRKSYIINNYLQSWLTVYSPDSLLGIQLFRAVHVHANQANPVCWSFVSILSVLQPAVPSRGSVSERDTQLLLSAESLTFSHVVSVCNQSYQVCSGKINVVMCAPVDFSVPLPNTAPRCYEAFCFLNAISIDVNNWVIVLLIYNMKNDVLKGLWLTWNLLGQMLDIPCWDW